MPRSGKQRRGDTKPALPVVLFTVGDPNGIGPELILRAFSEPHLFQQCIPVITGHREVLNYYARIFKLEVPSFLIRPGQTPRRDKLNFYLPPEDSPTPPAESSAKGKRQPVVSITPGVPTAESGEYAIKSIRWAIRALQEGVSDAVVTAPISKEAIQLAGHDYPGHTELLAEAFGVSPDDVLMLFAADELRVAMATAHIPLAEVPKTLTPALVEQKITRFITSLTDDFGLVRPRVAVCGLNPHAGENGRLGRDEKEWLGPLVEKLQQQGHDVFGPYPADGLWGSGLWAQFDGIMAMYHDQGLIPFKYIAAGRGVNFTAGLPIIRTSPTHGTAYAIAGEGKADLSSFFHAIWLALDLKARRAAMNEPAPQNTAST